MNTCRALLGFALLFAVAFPLLVPSPSNATVPRVSMVEEFGFFT
jgi:hypothetical protein